MRNAFARQGLNTGSVGGVVSRMGGVDRGAFNGRGSLVNHMCRCFLGRFTIGTAGRRKRFCAPRSMMRLVTAIVRPFSNALCSPYYNSNNVFVRDASLIGTGLKSVDYVGMCNRRGRTTACHLTGVGLTLENVDRGLNSRDSSAFAGSLRGKVCFSCVVTGPPFGLGN